MKQFIKNIIFNIPPVRRMKEELERYKTYHPPGHYYSPIPDKQYVRDNAGRIFDRSSKQLPGIDLRVDQQLELVRDLSVYGTSHGLPARKQEGFRYWFENPLFSWCDGVILSSMIRHFKPKRIIEAGSGYSSAVMLDVNEKYFNDEIDISLIEPYPMRLNGLTKGFNRNYSITEKFIQDLNSEFFKELQANDILFIDSTHVSKAGSDVNFILFELIPKLSSGVIIHFHDVFYPFEYPKEWIDRGYAWNEDYLLRAFLMYNREFELLLFNNFLEIHYPDVLQQYLPDTLKHPGGGLWLRKK